MNEKNGIDPWESRTEKQLEKLRQFLKEFEEKGFTLEEAEERLKEFEDDFSTAELLLILIKAIKEGSVEVKKVKPGKFEAEHLDNSYGSGKTVMLKKIGDKYFYVPWKYVSYGTSNTYGQEFNLTPGVYYIIWRNNIKEILYLDEWIVEEEVKE